MRKPLAVDLACGLGGWTDGLLAEGWDVVGFDIERHQYGSHQYPAQLVLQDILTLDGRQFRGKVSLIVASPPCQKYSYMAMPWKRSKALIAWYRDPAHPERIVELNALVDACHRIAREAECPIVLENVRGAQPWIGRARWMYGSFALWGDVPALMPMTFRAQKNPGFRFDGSGQSFQSEATKNTGGSWFNIPGPGGITANNNPTRGPRGGKARHDPRYPHLDPNHPDYGADGIKQGGDWFNAAALDKDGQQAIARRSGSKSSARKAASARIAKIPFPLASYIARTFLPLQGAA